MATLICRVMVMHTTAEAASGRGTHRSLQTSSQIDGGQIDLSGDAEKVHHPHPEDEAILMLRQKAVGAPHGMKAFAGCRRQLVAMDMVA